MAIKLVTGDRVTVYRKVKSCTYWVEGMDKFIGQSGTVIDMNVPKSPQVQMDISYKGCPYFIPASALKHERK